VTKPEGGSVTLQCKYTASTTTPDLFWYIQRENDIPKYMLRKNKYGGDQDTEFQKRFHSEVSSDSVPLMIQDLRVSDSAVYYCALRPTVTQTHSALRQKPSSVLIPILTHSFIFTSFFVTHVYLQKLIFYHCIDHFNSQI